MNDSTRRAAQVIAAELRRLASLPPDRQIAREAAYTLYEAIRIGAFDDPKWVLLRAMEAPQRNKNYAHEHWFDAAQFKIQQQEPAGFIPGCIINSVARSSGSDGVMTVSQFNRNTFVVNLQAVADVLDREIGLDVAEARKRGGRNPKHPSADEKLVNDWNAAKASGSRMKDFAKNKGTTTAAIKAAQGRVRSKNRYAQKKSSSGF